MLFTSAIALVAAAAVVRAQSAVTIDPATITQCATSTVTYSGSTGPYYVAVLSGSDLCGDALAEFYNVEGGSVDYFANIASGTQVQILVIDSSETESYSELITVGDGDASCLNGSSSSSVSESSTSTSSTESATVDSSPTAYVPPSPSNTAAAMTYTPSSSTNDNSNVADTPVNAQSDTSGASSVSASASLILGAIVAAAALL